MSIANYRNIADAELVFSPKLNCFVGPNGVGKTNLLDAIYYLSFCRSALVQKNSQVLRHNEEWMSLAAEYEDDNHQPLSIRCTLKAGHRKSFKKNGKEYKKQSEHIGLIPIVMVSPQDSELIVGGGDVRRRFMDMVISQYAPVYLHHLIRYNEALQQRNALLKVDVEIDEALLSAYDEVLSLSANDIFSYRKQFVEMLAPIFSEVYQQLGGDGEDVSIAYRSHLSDGELLPMLRAYREKDRIMGFTIKGVHRDDMEMTLGGYPLRYEGSQGQSKTYLIALKFAQYRLLAQQTASDSHHPVSNFQQTAPDSHQPVSNFQQTATSSEQTDSDAGNSSQRHAPILLLDDIFDKLDATRVQKIVRMVSGTDYGQIFITSTSSDTLHRVVDEVGGDYRFFQVEGGNYTLMD